MKRTPISLSLVGSVLLSFVLLAVTHVGAQRGDGANVDRVSQYRIKDLGRLADGRFSPFSQATFVNNNGLVTGLTTVSDDGPQHAVVWFKGRIMDIGFPGLGGPNSGAFGVNERGQVIGQAESATGDPNNENFCGYGTALRCVPFLWHDGVMTQLPTLKGGNNGTVGAINSRGEVAGIAETGTRDLECPPEAAFNGTGPQVLDFEAVIWGPRQGEIRRLRPHRGDSVGMAFGINDYGQAVGASGRCANTTLPPFAVGEHAVLWDTDDSVHDLGNLGGTANIAFSINNRAQVVGKSALPDNAPGHAFLWTRQTGMQDLLTLPGDVMSAGLSINDRGEVVGGSVDASGRPRPFLWKNGAMTDLNVLAPDSPLLLLVPFAINDGGDITGFGVQTSTGEIHAFLATPRHKRDW